jgi:hypothetical protein
LSLPYENATSGDRAMADVERILRGFGCTKFGSMMDFEHGELLVQFTYRSRNVQVRASTNGYAAAWLKHHPWSGRSHHPKIEHERRAKTIASKAIYSMVRDWIKGQTTAIETGILSFEGAFLGQILLPSGLTVLETAQKQKLLPAPGDDNVVGIGGKS